MEAADARSEGAKHGEGATYMSLLAHAISIVEDAGQENMESELGQAKQVILAAATDLHNAMQLFSGVPQIQQILDAELTVTTLAGAVMPGLLLTPKEGVSQEEHQGELEYIRLRAAAIYAQNETCNATIATLEKMLSESNGRYNELKAIVEASQDKSVDVSIQTPQEFIVSSLESKIEDLERELASSVSHIGSLVMAKSNLEQRAVAAADRESELRQKLQMLQDNVGLEHVEFATPVSLITDRPNRGSNLMADEPNESAMKLQAQLDSAAQVGEELARELELAAEHTRAIQSQGFESVADAHAQIKQFETDLEEARLYIMEVDEVVDTYLSALQQMCDDSDLSDMSAEEIVDLVRSYESVAADRFKAERDEIREVQNSFMQAYSEFNPGDGSPNLDSVLAWMRRGDKDSRVAASAMQPNGDKHRKSTARLSLLEKSKAKSGGEMMRLFVAKQSLLVRESAAGDKQLAAAQELILKAVSKLEETGITSDVQLLSTPEPSLTTMAAVKAKLMTILPPINKSVTKKEFFLILHAFSEVMRDSSRWLLAMATKQAAAVEDVNEGFTLYTAALTEAAEALPDDDKRSDKMARLKKISDIDNAYLLHMVESYFCKAGQAGVALKSALFGATGAEVLSIRMLDSMQGWLALATAVRYVR